MSPRTKAPEVVFTFDEAREILGPEPRLALDLETSGFSPWNNRVHVIALHGAESNTTAVLHYPKGVPVPMDVLHWLGDRPELVMHNGVMFDMLFLATHGMPWDRPKIYDTMIAEQAIRATNRKDVSVSLAATVKRHLGKDVDKSIEHGRWGNPTLDENQLAYVLGDITYMLRVREKQLKEAAETNTVRTVEFEMEVARPNLRMMLNGIPVDVGAIREYFSSRAARHEEVTSRLAQILQNEDGSPVLLTSPVKLKAALAALYGPKAFPDTKAERLMGYSRLGGPMAETCSLLLEWRSYTQRKNAFGEAWIAENVVDHDGDTRVHGRFWQLGTETGRFSSSKPNLQQLPSDMKHCFGNLKGHAVGKVDYAAIEVRVAAALANDEVMIAAFNAGEDIHRVVASAGFNKPPEAITKEERSIAKAMSFTLLFGGGIHTFRSYAANYGSDISQEDAENAVANFFSRFEGIHRMRQGAQRIAERGVPKTIVYPTGLRRQLRGEDLRASTLLNNVVQGSAAAGLKMALVEAEKAGVSKYLAAVVHDEIVVVAPEQEIREVLHEVEQCMLRGMKTALAHCPPIAIAAESTFGKTWKGDPANEHRAEG